MIAAPSIIIVDDDPLVCQILAQMVALLVPSATILTVENGEAALLLTAQHTPDLLLTDHYMPIMDGVELVRRLRARQATYPIVFLSASTEGISLSRAAGATCFVMKPFTLSSLHEALADLLDPSF